MQKERFSFRTKPEYIEQVEMLAKKENMTPSKFMHKLLKTCLGRLE